MTSPDRDTAPSAPDPLALDAVPFDGDAAPVPHPWSRHLDVRIAIEDVARGKPHPACYPRAAARLGVVPDRCLAVEDRLAGAQAAVAAGTTCRFVTNDMVDPVRVRAITPNVVAALLVLR